MSVAPESRWPGERLGLPEDGPRSVGRFGRRVIALFIDWGIAWVISVALFAEGSFQPNAWATLGVFAAEQLIFLWTINGSIGHLLVKLRVVPIVPGKLGWWRPVVRTALLCLAIPALIWDRDQRGLHDRAAGTVLVRV